MDCVADADGKMLSYFRAMWCVMQLSIFETYTVLTICILLAYALLWPLRKRLGLNSGIKEGVWFCSSLATGLVLFAVFVAPYLLFKESNNYAKTLNNKLVILGNAEKDAALKRIQEFLEEGRYLASDLKSTSQDRVSTTRTRITVWQEKIGLFFDSSHAYNKYKAQTTDQFSVNVGSAELKDLSSAVDNTNEQLLKAHKTIQ